MEQKENKVNMKLVGSEVGKRSVQEKRKNQEKKRTEWAEESVRDVEKKKRMNRRNTKIKRVG